MAVDPWACSQMGAVVLRLRCVAVICCHRLVDEGFHTVHTRLIGITRKGMFCRTRGISHANSSVKSGDGLIAVPFEVHLALLIL